jgi:hypothetical protein
MRDVNPGRPSACRPVTLRPSGVRRRCSLFIRDIRVAREYRQRTSRPVLRFTRSGADERSAAHRQVHVSESRIHDEQGRVDTDVPHPAGPQHFAQPHIRSLKQDLASRLVDRDRARALRPSFNQSSTCCLSSRGSVDRRRLLCLDRQQCFNVKLYCRMRLPTKRRGHERHGPELPFRGAPCVSYSAALRTIEPSGITVRFAGQLVALVPA